VGLLVNDNILFDFPLTHRFATESDRSSINVYQRKPTNGNRQQISTGGNRSIAIAVPLRAIIEIGKGTDTGRIYRRIRIPRKHAIRFVKLPKRSGVPKILQAKSGFTMWQSQLP